MANTRIPKNIDAFVSFMIRTNRYLLQPSLAPLTNLNWQRFNWLQPELDAWQAFSAATTPLYTLYTDKAHSGSANKTALKNLVTDAHNYDKTNHLLDRIAAGSPTLMNGDDYAAFNIKHNSPGQTGSPATHLHTATQTLVVFSIKGIGGGVMSYKARVSQSSNRASKLKGYDLGIVYLVQPQTDTAPSSINLLTLKESSTKASNTLLLGADAAGKRLVVSMYWKHKSNPALNGPCCPIQLVVIS